MIPARETCDECDAAKSKAFHPIYTAACKGCAVRSLAGSPQFYAGGVDGGDAKPYRRLLGAIFGDDWRAAHEVVKAERARQLGMLKKS